MADVQLSQPGDAKPTESTEKASDVDAGAKRKKLMYELKSTAVKLGTLVFILLPVFALLVSAFFGALLHAAEGWAFEECYFTVLGQLSSTGINVASVPAPLSHLGKLICCMIGLFSVAICGVVIALMGGPLIEPIIEVLHMEPSGEKPLRSALLQLAKLIFAILPVVAFTASILFGLILQAAEGGESNGWGLGTCFYGVLAELTGTTITVATLPAATTIVGRLFACLTGIWSISILGIVIGLIGGPLMDPIIQATRMEPKAYDGGGKGSGRVRGSVRVAAMTMIGS
jgi:hypothetical protein